MVVQTPWDSKYRLDTKFLDSAKEVFSYLDLWHYIQDQRRNNLKDLTSRRIGTRDIATARYQVHEQHRAQSSGDVRSAHFSASICVTERG